MTAAAPTRGSAEGAGDLLLVAYQCGPGMGSVSQIGWQWFTGMAARRPVCLVTHVRNREAIESAPDRPRGARVLYIDTEWFAGPLYRLARRMFPHSEHAVFMVSQLDWFVFDAVALRTLRQERAAGAPWRLLHLVTPVTTLALTRLHRLGLPVVRGPLNCGLPVPPGFADLVRQDGGGLSRLRAVPRLLERVVGSLRASHTVLVATRATRDAVPAAVRPRCVAMLENAVDPTQFSPPPPGAVRAGGPLRVCFVGRLVAVKALPLLLAAMARLRGQGVAIELVVVGDGPMGAAWQAQARELALDDAVEWRGAVPVAGVVQAMCEAHVFCLPSIRESGGAVLLEAMACGRPVIGIDFGGPGEVIDDDVGWKVAAPGPEAAIDGLAAALAQAAADPAACAARGRAARLRVLSRYTWAAKMRQADALYGSILRPRH